MLDTILQAGATVLLDPVTLGLMAIGTLAGLLAGAIPGFTIAMGVILTLPFTFGMSPIQGIATMIGVFVGRSFWWINVRNANWYPRNTVICRYNF